MSKDLLGWGYIRAIVLIPFFVKRVIGMRNFRVILLIPFFVKYWHGKILGHHSNTLLCQKKELFGRENFRVVVLIPFFVKRFIGMGDILEPSF